jgi:hypothetical protein
MVEPAELRPDELDRLEDALELLEVADIDDPSPAVRNRLGDFRRILQLSRSALPMVDVPRSVLERVVLEARQAAEVPVLEPAADAAPVAPRPGFWTRLRRFALLPGVALVGAAAMVLIMVERSPKDVAQSEHDTVAKTSADGRVAAEERTVVVPSAGEAAQARDQVPGAVPPPEVAAAATPASPSPARAPTPIVEPSSNADPIARDKGLDELGKSDEKKELAENEGDAKIADSNDEGPPRWDIIARGDRARQQNDCKSARTEYKLALGDADARVRARAHAGIGLCAAFDGETGAADSAYKAARELDPEISGFIDSERPRGGGTGSSNASRAKKATKKAKPVDDVQQQNADALDPME